MKIAVGGQLDKQKIADLITEKSNGTVEVGVFSDIEAAMAVKNGTADYYFGSCATGAGGSLAGAIAILGYGKCATISVPGSAPKKDKVVEAIDKGKVAFGFTNDHINTAIDYLLELLPENEG